jgi:DMSO/TMAO reductase YedYZ molybdopterin-dependent catalytic subunit
MPGEDEKREQTAAKAPSQKDFRSISRRELLTLTPLVFAGAFVLPKFQHGLLKEGIGFSDWATGKYFSGSRAAQTYKDSEVTPFAQFPYNGYDVLDPDVDLDSWTLNVGGDVTRPGEYTLAQIQALPKFRQNVRHICVEGWDVIGSFSGARAADFLRIVGANQNARFVEVECADDYYESYDMASFLHPQTLLAYEMYDKPLDREHGAPLRLNMPTKLGYKQSKYLTDLRITNVLKPEKRGYWEDQGYSWFAGL